MAKIITVLFSITVTLCNGGLLHYHDDFPNFKSIYHGHGATSYQNVQVQNHLSVPIPKDLQVDDGDSHHHDVIHHSPYHHYHHHDHPDSIMDELSDAHIVLEHPIVSSHDSYIDDNELIVHYDSEHYQPLQLIHEHSHH